MPLSEYEQRVLDQMERQLASDDPRLASTLQTAARRGVARYLVAGAGVLLGLLVLVVGAAAGQSWVGVLGFVLMFAGLTLAIVAPRQQQGPQGVVRPDGSVAAGGSTTARPGTSGRPAKRGRGGGFLARLEARWDRRRDQR